MLTKKKKEKKKKKKRVNDALRQGQRSALDQDKYLRYLCKDDSRRRFPHCQISVNEWQHAPAKFGGQDSTFST